MPCKFLSSLLLFICASLCSFGQIITVNGKVNDKNTGQPLPGATISIGNYGTSTDSKGVFVLIVDENIARKAGITASFLGYRKEHIDFNGIIYSINLTPDLHRLGTVVISAHPESIVQKAFRLIPVNFPDKGFTIKGHVRMFHTARVEHYSVYYYRNDAAVTLYFSTYANNHTPVIALDEKHDSLIYNPKAGFHVRFVGGYTSVAEMDYVHQRVLFLSGDTSHYQYVVNGKDWLNGRRVYVVSFYSRKNDESSGSMYIDTASYAFSRITMTKYHVKRALYIDIDKNTSLVDYEKAGNKWQLARVSINSITRHNEFDINRVTEFQAGSADTAQTMPLPYPRVIPDAMEDRSVPVSADADTRRTGKQLTLTPDTALTVIPIPPIDTTNYRQRKAAKGLESWRDYLIHDNIRSTAALIKMPFKLERYQPALNKNVSPATGYALDFDFQFRLYHGLFFQIDGAFNAGIGGLENGETAYSLIYNIPFHKGGHPFYLSPVFGRSVVTLSTRKSEYYNEKSIRYGLNLIYELSPRFCVFISGRYYDPYSLHNNAILYQSQPLTGAIGVLFKSKH